MTSLRHPLTVRPQSSGVPIRQLTRQQSKSFESERWLGGCDRASNRGGAARTLRAHLQLTRPATTNSSIRQPRFQRTSGEGLFSFDSDDCFKKFRRGKSRNRRSRKIRHVARNDVVAACCFRDAGDEGVFKISQRQLTGTLEYCRVCQQRASGKPRGRPHPLEPIQ